MELAKTDFAPDVVSYIVVSELTPEQIKDKINHLLDMKQIDVVPLEQGEPLLPNPMQTVKRTKRALKPPIQLRCRKKKRRMK